MRIGTVLLVLAVLAIGGGAAWWLLREEPRVADPIWPDVEEPVRPKVAREAPSGGHVPATIAPIPFEAPWNPSEQLPATGEQLNGAKLGLKPSLDDGMATGAELLEAWRGLKTVYVRWVGPKTREKFLKASLRLPPDAYLVPDQPGAPLAMFGFGMDEAGFEARFDLPLIRIGLKP